MVEIDQRDHGAFDRHQAGQEKRARGAHDVRHRLHLACLERDDVEHPVGQQAHLPLIDLNDDDDVGRRRFGQPLAEAAAQIDHRHHDAAQIQHPAHVVRLFRQGCDAGPFLDLAHRHDVDAVLRVADGEADEFGISRCADGVGGGIRHPSKIILPLTRGSNRRALMTHRQSSLCARRAGQTDY
jgi:hypothetical protein